MSGIIRLGAGTKLGAGVRCKVAPPVFVPSDLSGLVWWLDAAPAHLVLSGGLVDTARDRSGNAYDFDGSGAARPTSTTDSGTPAIYYDGGSKYLSRAYTAAFNTAEQTFVAFCRVPSYGTYRAIPVPLRASSGADCFDWWDNGSTEYLARTSLAISGASGGPTNRTMRALVIGASNVATSYKDAAVTVVQTGTIGGASGDTSTRHYLGTRAGDLFTIFYGYLYTSLIYNRALSGSELAQLAAWGVSQFSIT